MLQKRSLTLVVCWHTKGCKIDSQYLLKTVSKGGNWKSSQSRGLIAIERGRCALAIKKRWSIVTLYEASLYDQLFCDFNGGHSLYLDNLYSIKRLLQYWFTGVGVVTVTFALYLWNDSGSKPVSSNPVIGMTAHDDQIVVWNCAWLGDSQPEAKIFAPSVQDKHQKILPSNILGSKLFNQMYHFIVETLSIVSLEELK